MEKLTKEEKVMLYINSNPNGILVFGGNPLTFSIEPELPKLDNVYDLIHEVLERAMEFNSVNPEIDDTETTRGRRRSSIDIWRHVKSVLPDTSIFEVMRELHRYCLEDLRCGVFFCGGVKRMVFRFVSKNTKEHGDRNLDKSRLDEYGIMLADWKTIGLNKEKLPVKEMPYPSPKNFEKWNPYYNPFECGLKVIYSEDRSSGNYEFDILFIVMDLKTGLYYKGEDSGCSCPTPFEDFHSLDDFTQIDQHEVKKYTSK